MKRGVGPATTGSQKPVWQASRSKSWRSNRTTISTRSLRDACSPVRSRFRLELELAEDHDPVDDPSAMWPDGRKRVAVGRLELLRPVTEGEIGDPVMMHDPTAVTDGIEISPDDQIIAARRGAYLVCRLLLEKKKKEEQSGTATDTLRRHAAHYETTARVDS